MFPPYSLTSTRILKFSDMVESCSVLGVSDARPFNGSLKCVLCVHTWERSHGTHAELGESRRTQQGEGVRSRVRVLLPSPSHGLRVVPEFRKVPREATPPAFGTLNTCLESKFRDEVCGNVGNALGVRYGDSEVTKGGRGQGPGFYKRTSGTRCVVYLGPSTWANYRLHDPAQEFLLRKIHHVAFPLKVDK